MLSDLSNILSLFRQRMFWTWIVVGYWLLISSFALWNNHKTLKKWSKRQSILDQKFQGVARTDSHLWRKTAILIGSCTLFPIKFFCLANFLVGALLLACLISLIPVSMRNGPQKLMFLYFNTYGWFMNNLAFSIKEEFTSESISTPIIISNHVCWFDTFYITLGHSPVSYVAKHEIQFWPVIGIIAKAMSCIFVKRETEDGRNSTLQKIKQRVNDFKANEKSAYPLVIYPEGTQSDGRSILKFKRGAFANLSPITALCLRYSCYNFEMGEEEISQLEHITLSLSQRPKLRVKKIKLIPFEGQTEDQYMNRCRRLVAEAWDFREVNAGHREVRQLAALRKQQRKAS